MFRRLQLLENGFYRRHYSATNPRSQWGLCPTGVAFAVLLFSVGGVLATESNRWSAGTLSKWQALRPTILSNMQAVMGPMPKPSQKSPLNLEIKEEADAGNYLRRTIAYTPEPGSRVHAYLLVPKAVKNAPAVLALHQTHQLGPKVVVGLGDSPNDTYGVELANRGYVVLAPPYPLLGEYAPDLKKLGYVSGTMKAIWDNVRALDVLESLSYVRTNGFGAIGHSLGGHNALFTAAFDERIKVVATSCAFDSFRDYMNGNIKGWTSTRYMPRLLDYSAGKYPFDFHDVLGLIAPRRVFASAPISDSNFKWRSVDDIAQEVWPIYRFYNAEENLQIVHPDCGHVFPPEIREQAYKVFDKVLGGDGN
jgi:dienelactone hydrolase